MAKRAARVVVMGGGVAGMSAAHELVERGFDVLVLEAKAVPGGKARSITAPPSGLPGEHGFRFFPSFYRHVTDTMRRIPFAGNRDGVLGNLVDTTRAAAARFGRPLVEIDPGFPRTLEELEILVRDAFGNPFGLLPDETRFFADRLWQIATSSAERRLGEYERLGWWEFIAADRFSANYRAVLGSTTRSLVAADPRKASARTIGDITLQAVLGMATPGKDYDRVLNGPTSAVWIDPWLADLREKGVDYRLSRPVHAIHCDGTRVTGIESGGETHSGDWYVAAMPVERMARLVSEPLRAADPGLARIAALAPHVQWMNGIQFYLTRETPIVHGHVLYVDAPWALTSIAQAQFWPHVDFASYGDGRVRDSFSVDVSDWNTPGLGGKPAKHCTREEIRDEVWRQIQKSVNVAGTLRLSDEELHSWFLDPDIRFDPETGIASGDVEPLLVNEAGTWDLRPQAFTAIPNLFLASDYVQTNTDLACMEGANEAARRAVNCILEASKSPATACEIWPLHEPEILLPWRLRDRDRYLRGLPWDGSVLR